jgi:hypothetical protein
MNPRAVIPFAVVVSVTMLLASVFADPPAVPTGSLAERLRGARHADNRLPDWQPISAAAAAASHEIVMAPGLLVVTAINQGGLGDYESIKTVDAVDGKSVRLQYSATLPASARQGVDAVDPEAGNKLPIKVSCTRTIDVADMQSAHGYGELFCGTQGEHNSGTTAISVSTEVLTQLRANKQVPFHYQLANTLKVFERLGRLVEAPGSATLAPQTISCVLRRVEPAALAVPVLLDDQPAQLPALHAACVNTKGKVDFYFLDHPGNPIVLAWQGDAISGRLQVIRIQQASLAAQHKVRVAAATAGGRGR